MVHDRRPDRPGAGRLPVVSLGGIPNSGVARIVEILYVVVTACSMDLAPINGGECTGLRLEVSP